MFGLQDAWIVHLLLKRWRVSLFGIMCICEGVFDNV